MKKRARLHNLASFVFLSAAACGHSAETAVDATGAGAGPTTTTGSGGSGGSGGASGGGGSVVDAGPIDAGPPPDGGCFGASPLPPFSPGGWCPCEPTKGFVLEGSCGSISLPAPFYASHDPPICALDGAFYTAYTCKYSFSHNFAGCLAQDTAPCISLTWNHFGGTDTYEGWLIDGTGENFTLSEIVLHVANFQPLSPPSVVSGKFKATATSMSGSGKTMPIGGSFEICRGNYLICPL